MTIRASYQMKVPGSDRFGSILVREDREAPLAPDTDPDEAAKVLHAACRASVEEQVRIMRDVHPQAPRKPPRDPGTSSHIAQEGPTEKQKKALHARLLACARRNGCQVASEAASPADVSWAYSKAIDALKAALTAKGVSVS